MILEHISPCVRLAKDSCIPAPWYLSDRDIWDYEIVYLQEGKINVTVEGQTYNGIPGDIFLFKPQQTHSIQSIGNASVRQPHIHFDLFQRPDSEQVNISYIRAAEMTDQEKSWFRPDDLSSPPLLLPNHIRLNNPIVFEKMLFDLIYEFQMKIPFYEANLKGMFIKLFIYLLREHQCNQPPHIKHHHKELLDIQQYLDHQVNQDITLDELAQVFNISKYHLSRLFKENFQTSPIQYHQAARMKKAKELIQFTNLSMKQIADQLGFQSIHTFSRAFKNQDGSAPSFYRHSSN